MIYDDHKIWLTNKIRRFVSFLPFLKIKLCDIFLLQLPTTVYIEKKHTKKRQKHGFCHFKGYFWLLSLKEKEYQS